MSQKQQKKAIREQKSIFRSRFAYSQIESPKKGEFEKPINHHIRENKGIRRPKADSGELERDYPR